MPALARRRPVRATRPATVARADGQGQVRALTAAAARIDQTDRDQARLFAGLRNNWQAEAWSYRRQLGELRYATSYLGNSAMRMRLFPASYAPGESVPRPAEEVSDIPRDLIAAAGDCLLRLGIGENNSGAQLIKKVAENFETTGECYLVGREEAIGGGEDWSLFSTSEFHIDQSGNYGVRVAPGTITSSSAMISNGIEPFNPGTFISRLWWPDPEWGMLADAPVRSILDVCEELVLLGKEVRSSARSRLANNGILLIPDNLSVVATDPAVAADPRMDPLMQEFIKAATANLTDEGAASAVVPITLRGPGEALRLVRHLPILRPEHQGNIAARQELIGRMATGIDLPAEVLTGKADLNHWSAWQVDDDAFRHHIEPIVQVIVDALTVGYLWRMLAAYGLWSPEQIRRVVIWYDPTELVTHPDRSQDAKDAFDRGAIGRNTLRDFLGMNDSDAPDELDEILYVLGHARGVDPTLLTAILRTIAKTIVIPDASPRPVPGVPATPGLDLPGGPSTPTPPPTGGPGTPATSPPVSGPPADSGPPGGTASTADLDNRLLFAKIDQLAQMASDGVVFEPTGTPRRALDPDEQLALGNRAGPVRYQPTDQERRASNRMSEQDRLLRDKLQVAGNQAIKRGLEKAGAKVVNRVRGKAAQTASAATGKRFDFSALQAMPKWQIPARVGQTLVAAIGYDDAADLLDEDMLAELHDLYDSWVASGQTQVLREAANLVGADTSAAFAQLDGKLKGDRDAGWQWLEDQATKRATKLLSDAGELDNLGDLTGTVETASSLLPTGLVRGALSIAGGRDPSTLNEDGTPVDGTPVGGVGTGATISQFITDNGGAVQQYEWHHGYSDRPFEPHMELDGLVFSDFDDPALAVDPSFGSWGADFWAVGDHNGCSCDLNVLYSAPSADAGGDDSGGEPAEPELEAIAASADTEEEADWDPAAHPKGADGRFVKTGPVESNGGPARTSRESLPETHRIPTTKPG